MMRRGGGVGRGESNLVPRPPSHFLKERALGTTFARKQALYSTKQDTKLT